MNQTVHEAVAGRRLLVIDDDHALLGVLARFLTQRGFEVTTCESGEEAVDAARAQQHDGAVIDFSLIGSTGHDVMVQLRAIDPTLAIVLLSGSIEVPDAVRAIRNGAEDVQLKPPSMDLLQAALERGLERTRLLRSRRLSAAHVADPYGVLDPSPNMQRVIRQVQHAARLEIPIVLIGEAGTGKRAIAEMAHQLSSGADGTFVSIALQHLAPQEVEHALARAFAELADDTARATLFLDDLATLSIPAQACLRRLLESPVIRLIVSTRRNLADDVRAGLLSADLHQRLVVMPVAVPSLSERGATAIETLAMRMLARMRIEAGEGPDRFTRSTLDWLCNSRWPANIPQLRDVVSESFIRAVGEAEIDTHHVAPSLVARGLHAGNTATETEDWTLGAVERRHVLSVLGMSGQNRSLAARTLGITRTTLYKKLAEYGVEGEA